MGDGFWRVLATGGVDEYAVCCVGLVVMSLQIASPGLGKRAPEKRSYYGTIRKAELIKKLGEPIHE